MGNRVLPDALGLNDDRDNHRSTTVLGIHPAPNRPPHNLLE